MNWDELGLMMGLEIHQQLDSEHKLFCSCKNELIDEDGDEVFERKLKATESHTGKIDRAAYAESKRDLSFKYQAYNEKSCLIEIDEEPPANINEEALDISLTIASLLNMQIVDEFHTMRKQVIDGSNTGGFQRTGLLATDGYLDTDDGRVIIETLGLEEDAARRIETTNDEVTFRLDRLGIPLAEITTNPSMHTPKQVKDVAYQIGQILRSTKVKRGLGTIRQDLNISIKEGKRVELKGVQDLDNMPTIVEREVTRQIKLIEIMKELKNREASVDEKIYDISEVFHKTKSKILQQAKSIKAIKLNGFNGLIGMEIQKGRRLGTEFASYAKKMGVSGIFHTDELPAYGITEREVDDLRNYLSANIDDAIIIVAHDEEIAVNALNEVIRRAKMCFDGVVEETRKALDDGNSEYMRPLPTANRMYLETDLPSLIINEEKINKIQNNLPELPDVKKERIIKEYNLSEDLAGQLVRKNYVESFENILKEIDVDTTILGSLLAYTLKEVERECEDISFIDRKIILELLNLLNDNKISKESFGDILTYTVKNKSTPGDSAEKLGLVLIDEDEVKAILKEIVDENSEMVNERKMAAMGPLMGKSMKKLKGKADGKLINKLLKEEINKKMG